MLTNWQTISKRVGARRDRAAASSGRIDAFSKKEQLAISREYEKLNKNLGGIRHMKGLPAALFIIDTVEEETAVREANKLGIPVIGIVDTNSDPDDIMFPVPGNDDAIRAITLYARTASDAIGEGRSTRSEGKVEVQAPAKEPAAATVSMDDAKDASGEAAAK